MPEVNLSPRNQCTFDDPTDGAQPPSLVAAPPELDAGSNAIAAARAAMCHGSTAGASGRSGDECTSDLVRRFSGEGGAPATPGATSAPEPKSCIDASLRALQTCSPILLDNDATPLFYEVAQVVGCGAAVGSLVECLMQRETGVR